MGTMTPSQCWSEVARQHGKALAPIALAWRLNKSEIHASVVGVSKIAQLDPNDGTHLEELYQPV